MWAPKESINKLELICGFSKLAIHATLKVNYRDFPGGPVVKTSPSHACGAGLIPGQGTKIPHAVTKKPNHKNKKQYCNKFNKGFQNGPHQKIFFFQERTNSKINSSYINQQ